MKKNILVTGANGYLGYYVCLELLRQGYNVFALKHKHFASRIILDENIQYLDGDIGTDLQNNETLNQLVEKNEVFAILNLAALLGSSDYDKNYQVNAQGVQFLIDFAKRNNITRFIQISSVVILKKIKGPYGETKLIGQQFIEKSKLDYTVFIPAMILGPESLGLNRVLKNVFRLPVVVPIIGSGKQTQHPIFVKDFAKYIVLSIDKPQAFRKTYEIAGDTVISFKNFIALILKVSNKSKIFVPIPAFVASLLGKFFEKTQKIPLFTSEHVKGVLQSSSLNTDPIKKDLGFSPTPLETSLKYSLDIIGNNWNYYMNPRDEEKIPFNQIDK